MEHKIGELFKNEHGLWYQCIPSDTHISDDCYGCCFLSLNCCICNKTLIGKCDSEDRKDGKSVIFKQIKSIGQPLQIGDKIMQMYKVFVKPYVPKELGYFTINSPSNLAILIEVKQTKENMEEYRMHDAKEDIPEFDKVVDECLFGEDKLNLKPFDLEAAKAGKAVCTRGGRKVRIICFDGRNNTPIVALIERDNHEEVLQCYLDNGRCFRDVTSDYDLMMLTEKKEGWVNVYSNCLGGPYESKECALKQKMKDCIDTVKISWEE